MDGSKNDFDLTVPKVKFVSQVKHRLQAKNTTSKHRQTLITQMGQVAFTNNRGSCLSRQDIMPTYTNVVAAGIYKNTHMHLLRLLSSVCECTLLCSSSGALSRASFHRKQPIGSPKVNRALATQLYPLQPLPLPLFNYLSLFGRLAELYVGQR